MTGLNRWFPLAAPSDHLFFLPQRTGVDTSKKLRLISSASGPIEAHSERRNSAPTRWKFRSTHSRHGRMQSMTRLFFGSLPFPSALSRSNSFATAQDNERRGVLRTVDCDHYNAVPLSDGAHVLFTDPATGLLCLGSDAPLGGPTKLMRKVAMVPPVSDTAERASRLICYRAARDLQWGVRVAAAYEDGQVMLYNIPSDCFERIRHIRSAPDVWDELAGVVGQSDLLMDVFMASDTDVSSNNENGDGATLTRYSSNSSTASKSFRSVQIDGAVIYNAEYVQDLQVDCSGGGVKIWVFMRDKAVRLSVYAPRNFRPVQKYVGADGLVHYDDVADDRVSGKGKERVSLPAEDAPVEKEEAVHEGVKFVVFE